MAQVLKRKYFRHKQVENVELILLYGASLYEIRHFFGSSHRTSNKTLRFLFMQLQIALVSFRDNRRRVALKKNIVQAFGIH